MPCTIPEFRTRFPEFADEILYPDSIVQLALDDAAMDLPNWATGNCAHKADRAHCLLAAHLLAIQSMTAAGSYSATAGAIISKTAGGVSVTREGTKQSVAYRPEDAYLMSTIYGQQYIVLRDSCISSFVVAVANRL